MAPSPSTERRLLQVAVAAAGFVPVGYGLAGAILGGAMTGETLAPPALDSQLRDLSGVLLGLGLAFWEALPQIERRGPRIRLLTLVMMLGGVIRLTGFGVVAYPGPAAVAALVMELGIFPLLCLWQARVARRCGWAG